MAQSPVATAAADQSMVTPSIHSPAARNARGVLLLDRNAQAAPERNAEELRAEARSRVSGGPSVEPRARTIGGHQAKVGFGSRILSQLAEAKKQKPEMPSAVRAQFFDTPSCAAWIRPTAAAECVPHLGAQGARIFVHAQLRRAERQLRQHAQSAALERHPGQQLEVDGWCGLWALLQSGPNCRIAFAFCQPAGAVQRVCAFARLQATACLDQTGSPAPCATTRSRTSRRVSRHPVRPKGDSRKEHSASPQSSEQDERTQSQRKHLREVGSLREWTS